MLQFISHCTERYTYLDSIRLALEGGCRWIQLRMKDATDEEVRPIALVAQRLCHEAGATFIIDDRVGLVRELHADGVHLGQNDMPIREARRLLGDGFIIGGTANTFDQVRAHYESSADYIGCGPFRFTTTKQKLAPVLGLDGYRTIISEMEEAHIHIPIVAIGGITEEDIPDILQTGVSGIALSGTVLRADDPVQKMKQLINTVNHE
ncbi:thiamine-phosphate pyrophosphorylase [Prevotella aff. ruminicola Tc2-24]|jgi:thiamine-phosphate pyrophosphorylase|uniref:Thiamine-phosphate synthase n=2 Tax=Prevotellaceae TaxID=171552 RepID=A0A1I0P2Z1_9BACT|nr:thiamine-phosphate pyrophosphorylase [Prevotella sp. lc2012]SEW08535.1 thiamine-phosphate pyrophosphorylase [Prevotella aff. ruminicola Tc2-24]